MSAKLIALFLVVAVVAGVGLGVMIPDPDPDPEPTPEPEPDPMPDPIPEPDPEPSPEPDPEPMPDPQPEPTPEPEPDPELFTDDMVFSEDLELMYYYGPPSGGTTYVYRIATITNYPAAVLTGVAEGSGDQISLSFSEDRQISSSITTSVGRAVSCTIGTSTSISGGAQLDLKIFKFGLDIGSSWSSSSTTSEDFSKSISTTESSGSGWTAQYTVSDSVDGYHYRIAYVYSLCEVYQYIEVDGETGERNVEYGVGFRGEPFIQLQCAPDNDFSIPAHMHIEVDVGDVPDVGTFGTEDRPFSIMSVKDLQMVSPTEPYYYVLGDDLDISGVYWRPKAFCGTLDGQGYSIYGLRIDERDYSNSIMTGLFTSSSGTIRNLNLGSEDIGGTIDICPYNNGKETHVKVGGIAAINSGTIEGCTIINLRINACTSDIVEKNRSAEDWPQDAPMSLYVGGVTGRNSGEIRDCEVLDSEIKGMFVHHVYLDSGRCLIGGIVGGNHLGLVEGCYSNSVVDCKVDVGYYIPFLRDYNFNLISFVGGIAGCTLEADFKGFDGTVHRYGVESCDFDGQVTYDKKVGTKIGVFSDKGVAIASAPVCPESYPPLVPWINLF